AERERGDDLEKLAGRREERPQEAVGATCRLGDREPEGARKIEVGARTREPRVLVEEFEELRRLAGGDGVIQRCLEARALQHWSRIRLCGSLHQNPTARSEEHTSELQSL